MHPRDRRDGTGDRAEADLPDARGSSAIHVEVQAGPETGRRARLGDQPLKIGRGVDEDLQLSDSAISRHHLTIVWDPRAGMIEVIEAPGANPAWILVDGRRKALGAGDQFPLKTRLTVGNSTLGFDEVRPAGPTHGEPATVPGRTTIEASVDSVGGLGDGPGAPSRGGIRALCALGDQLARCASLQAVYRAATSWAVDVLPATRAILLSPDGSDILAASAGGPIVDLAISKALRSRVLSEKRAFLVHDVLAEPDLASRQSVQLRGIQGAMAAPVANLVFYAEWGAKERIRGDHNDDTLTLLVCAAQLVGALGESAEERSQLRALASQSRTPMPVGRVIGGSPALQRLQVFLQRVAGTRATILLNGESGTGKELAASMVHALSERRHAPFVAINCASVAETLLESEFFGHEKGAFTGAVRQHQGVFERAHTGTLFLDEVAEMSAATQARMLRVLETGCFTRVGGSQDVQVDVRLIAATHADLRRRVEEGSFREDLFYRLSVIQTTLPPLRDRQEDIPELVHHFAETLGAAMGRNISSISPAALEILSSYRWPGNVRELRNVVERALVLGDGPTLEVDDLPPELQHVARSAGISDSTTPPAVVVPLAQLEAEAIAGALRATEGNKARAAALLGIDRTTLYRKLKERS